MLRSVVGLDSREEGRESSLVTGTDISDGNNGGSLLVDKSTETGLTLDNGVRNTDLSAESRDEDDKLKGVNVISNQNKLGLLVLNEGNNVLKTVLDSVGLLRNLLLLLALGNSSSLLLESGLLLSTSLGAVVVQELESLSSGALVKNVLELSNGRRNLKTKRENLLLSLETNVSGPLDESVQIALGLNTVTEAEALGGLKILLDQKFNYQSVKEKFVLTSVLALAAEEDLAGWIIEETKVSNRINM